MPYALFFKPVGVPRREMETITLTLDELESIRLADLEGKYQEEAAKVMNISRQTFGNILKSAHRKIADGLVNARAISIEGGVFEIHGERTFVCELCGYQWTQSFDTDNPGVCPECGSADIYPFELFRGVRRPRRRRNRNRNRGAGR